MGNSAIKNQIFLAITANDPIKLKSILQRYPSFLNEPISDDQKTNSVTRAAYLGKPHILATLAELGADLNRPGGSDISALMWSAARGHVECCKFLLDFGVNPDQVGPFDMTAIDFAILYGWYNTAYFLYSYGIRPTKSTEEFEEIRQKKGTLWVDFSGLLISLEKMVPPEESFCFTIPPEEPEELLIDPVPDPNETWKSWFRRVLEFEEPPLVERSVIPEDQQPQRKLTGKLRILLKLDKPPVEHDSSCEFSRQVSLAPASSNRN